MQNGRSQFIGRWRSGLLALNASKSDRSATLKTGSGSLNLVKPRYSSFKVAGVQFRRQRHTAWAQLAYLAVQALAALLLLLLRLLGAVLWAAWLRLCFCGDFVRGFLAGTRAGVDSRVESPCDEDNE